MHKSIDDKLLPNLIIVLLCAIFLLATLAIGSIFFIKNITDKENIDYMIKEINVFAIPVDSIVTSNIMGEDFKKKSTINDAILTIAKENDISSTVIYDIFNDERIYNQMSKQLYANIKLNYQKKNYFSSHESNTTLIEKVISFHESKNKILLTANTKNQIITIISSYMYSIGGVLATSSDDFQIVYDPITTIIIIGIIILSGIGIILIEKDSKKTLFRLSNIWLFTALFISLYAFIQKGMIIILEHLIANYSYNANIVSSNMFISMIEFAMALLVLSLFIKIMSKENFKYLTLLFNKKKSKTKRKKKTKKKAKKKTKKKRKKKIKKKVNNKFTTNLLSKLKSSNAWITRNIKKINFGKSKKEENIK